MNQMRDPDHLTCMMHGSHENRPDREEEVRIAQRAIDGCHTSFERLARQWHPKLVAHACRLLGHREQARDAAQSAWVKIAKGIRTLRDARAFPAWSYRIVTRRCASLIASNQTDRALASNLRDDAVTCAGTEQEPP
ncbi:RNA polymerase, sigma-24 subunit, ECF subfamily (plasmid) [Novosphingobium aromaticivorans DSM 12444]|uniref:RNA polymerase, sigma-24 subunit, ECF subfamily n=4 Tax=Novosphingobium TaxID=165696 RepID=A4XDZ4_NOVAD|nr:RNA polymerase, sigma-24 subunit, ECF subfamily [Novosphingobium aromaticivorans DSM 12444]